MTVDRYGVVGNPVAHSLSPQIHAAFARQTGVDLEYRRILAPLDAFIATAETFFEDGGRGLNVTVPFKLQAFAWCGDRITARARRAGAVNCVACDDEGLHGDNTDGAGLVDDLRRLLGDMGLSLSGSRLLLLGAGGAARGVLGPLAATGAHSIVVVNRDHAKAEALADARTIEALPMASIGDRSFDVIVNATSASLGGASLTVPAPVLGGAHLVYDMMYGAEPTPFLVEAGRAGARATADGLGMLVEQAAESFFLWRGVRPRTGPVREALRATLQASR